MLSVTLSLTSINIGARFVSFVEANSPFIILLKYLFMLWDSSKFKLSGKFKVESTDTSAPGVLTLLPL